MNYIILFYRAKIPDYLTVCAKILQPLELIGAGRFYPIKSCTNQIIFCGYLQACKVLQSANNIVISAPKATFLAFYPRLTDSISSTAKRDFYMLN